ncbi:hypothetical protein NVP1084O_009 [Vibrio phage 1.084.O._10N.261.49.F5]|nr:hypothetical protein NVP1084O_009 [Vibrio phage 1.084.O._10N.261.49.F5]
MSSYYNNETLIENDNEIYRLKKENEILRNLLLESFDKVDYLLRTPNDTVWVSKVTDWQASTSNFLNGRGLMKDFYKHNFNIEEK